MKRRMRRKRTKPSVRRRRCAIPTQIKQYLKEDEFKVYKLIWQRFVASQINPAVFDQTTVDIDAKHGNDSLLVPRDRIGPEVRRLPESLRRIERRQRRRRRGTEAQAAAARSRTEAHAQGTEAGAALHRAAAALQRSVAGERTRRARHRPSFHLRRDSHTPFRSGSTCTKTGRKICARPKLAWSSPICWSKTSATFSMSQYTARLEEELDEIEEGKEKWTDALADFYKKFQKDLKYAEKHMENIKRMEKPTDEKCERCGSPLVIKWGKHGSFYACSSYDKENPEQLHLHQGKSHQPARPRFGGHAGDRAGRILRELRPGDGAEARTLRPVHGLHRLSGLQDHAPSRSRQEAFPTFRSMSLARSADAT